MAQSPKGGLYGPLCKRHLGVPVPSTLNPLYFYSPSCFWGAVPEVVTESVTEVGPIASVKKTLAGFGLASAASCNEQVCSLELRSRLNLKLLLCLHF